MNSTTQELSELTKTTAASLHSVESNKVELLNPAKWRYPIQQSGGTPSQNILCNETEPIKQSKAYGQQKN
jgi:hypothetical protein